MSDEPADPMVIIGLLHSHLAAERTHADALAEGLDVAIQFVPFDDRRYDALEALVREHDRMREAER